MKKLLQKTTTEQAVVSNANSINMNLMQPVVLWCLIFTENVSFRRSCCSPLTLPAFFSFFFWHLLVAARPSGMRVSSHWQLFADLQYITASEKKKAGGKTDKKKEEETRAISGLTRGQTVVTGFGLCKSSHAGQSVKAVPI